MNQNIKSFFNDISIMKTIMMFYLLIFTSVISDKIKNKISMRVEENLIIKHIIGLITVGVLLSMVYQLDIKELILYSLVIYSIFLLSTKISSNYVLLAILVSSGIYFMDYFNQNKLKNIKIDQSIDSKNKEIIMDNLHKKSKHITIFYIGAVILGSLLYDEKKYKQFGGSYSLLKELN